MAEENFDILAVEDRLAHKSWKARLSAYTELVSLFQKTISETDPIFRNYVNNAAGVTEWVKDSNAVSQEKGVEAACALIEHGGTAAARSRAEVVPTVVEKCLGSARAGTRTKALELCLLYVESEADKGEGVIQDLISGLAAKQPKVVAGSVTVLKEIVRSFGTTTINAQAILPILPKIFAHADKSVRSEGTLLCLALHSFLGPKLSPHLSKLKPVQVKELNDGFAEADGKGEGFGAKQIRFTKSQQKINAVKEAEGALEGNVEEEVEEIPEEIEEVDTAADPYLTATPIDVNDKLPPDFYTHIASAKWKDRKESALDPLLILLKSSLRVKPGNYDELTRALGGRMTDANVACMMLAANCLEYLALGLRTDFGRYKSNVLTGILERTKEKKQNLLDALGGALDAIFLSVPFSEIVEEIVLAGKHKNPSVKAETFKWLARSLKIVPTSPSKSDSSQVATVLIASLGDSGEPVRVAAAEALGTLMKCVGEEVFSRELEGLDALRKEKVMEQFKQAEVKCKVGGKSAPKAVAPLTPAPAPIVAKPKPKPIAKPPAPRPPMNFDDDEQPLAPSAPIPRPLAKAPVPRPVVKKSAPSTSAPIKKPAAGTIKAAPSKGVEAMRYKFNQEEAEALAETTIPAEINTGLSDSNWKNRLTAMESLHNWLSGGEIENVESELIVRYLSKKPGWKESNFQVGAKLFGILQLLAETSPSFSKASAALSIPALSDKLGDIKLKKPAGDALTVFAEKSSIQFVLSQAFDPMIKQKAPKAQADSLLWVEQSLREFGIAGLSIMELIDFLKNGLKSTNAAVRTSATKTLVTVKLCVGATDITTFIQDLNPALLTTIEAEFEKISKEPQPEPTRFSADDTTLSSGPALSSPGAGGKDNSEAALDELFPRVDLEKLLTTSNVNSCNDANWKIRKESLELIETILEEHKRLKPANISDLTAALKSRLADSNKVVQTLALKVVALLAAGMGKPFERQAKILAGPVAAVLADQKASIRLAGVNTLSALSENCGLDSILPYLDKPLEAQNPVLRKDLLLWLETQFDKPEIITGVDLTSIAGPVLACLEDRMAEVRKAATALLPAIITSAGYNTIVTLANTLKPASRNTVLPLLESARGSGSGSAPAPKAAPVTATAPRGGVKPLRRPESSVTPTPPSEEAPLRAIGRPRPSLTLAKPKSTVSSARATPIPPAATVKEPPFKSADGQPKLIRQSKDVGSAKWVIDGIPRPEQIEQLYNQMSPHVNSELLAQLFSKDHNAEKDFVAGLVTLDDCAREPKFAESQYDLASEELAARLVANVDLMFKYITIRLVLSSTVITVKCLDLIDHLIPLLSAESHRLSEYEATSLLISLVAKVGDGKETIRQRVRNIFKAISNIYPFSKIFSVILDYGLTSKNSRTRAESAEELGSILQRCGVHACSLPKALPLIAKLISDRDPAVRTAALICIGSAYTLIGSDLVYKHIGAIPDKERTMLEERLKRTASPTRTTVIAGPGTPSRLQAPSKMVSGISRPAPAPSGLRRPANVAVSSISSASELLPRSTHSPAPSRIGAIARPPLSSNNSSTSRLSKYSSNDSASVNPTRLISAVITDDPINSINALKALEIVIGSDQDSLVPLADQLIEAIVQQLQVGFGTLSEFSSDSVFRLCRHLLAALSGIFDQKGPLGIAVSPNALSALLADLAGRLLDTADAATRVQGESDKAKEVVRFSKALNIILIKVFSSSNQTSLFTALFSVLKDATRDLRELRGEELSERAKYAELVMKCLWKVSKSVKESLENQTLSPALILRDIDQFLETTPPAEWRRRATDGIPLTDMPLRTVKTVLQQIVSVCGDGVFNELYEIDSAENSYVYQYVYRLVHNTTGANNEHRGSVDAENMARVGSTASIARALPPRDNAPSPQLSIDSNTTSRSIAHGSTLSEGAMDIATNNELKVIFDRIGDPGQSRAGIAELYEYRKRNPIAEAKIQLWMATTGNYFQTYLRRALDNLATSERERTTSAGSNEFNSPTSETTTTSRPLSTASSRRASLIASNGTPPRAPRSPRPSSGVGATTPSTRKLQELQSLFGFKDTASGRME